MICLSLSHSAIGELKRLVQRYAKEADILEIRLDLLANPMEMDFDQLVTPESPPLIFTNRKAEEGGRFKGDEKQRIRLLMRAIQAGANYIDIELATRQDLRDGLIEKAHNNETKVIVSYHNFESTPESDEILKIFNRMAKSGADIIKIVTMATDPLDFIKLAPVFQMSQKSSLPVIAFCMGEKGRFSRIFSLNLGSFLTFAAPDSSTQTAPGQIPIGLMKKIFSLLQATSENKEVPF